MTTEAQPGTPGSTTLAPVAAAAAAPTATIAVAAAPASISLAAPTPTPIDPTGDPALDLALEFFAKHGLDGRHPALKAARDSGDFSAIKAVLAEKGDAAKGFDRYVDIAQRAADGAKATATAGKEKTAQAIYAIAGSKEVWDGVRDWATTNATDEERAEVNTALNKGGLIAKAMATMLMSMHGKANGQAKAPERQSALPTDAARHPSQNTTGSIDPRAFQKGVADIVQKHGPHGLESRAEYKQLLAARQAYRA